MESCLKHIEKIDNMRKKLAESGVEHGFTHKKTVHISQQLDIIIAKYAKSQLKGRHRK